MFCGKCNNDLRDCTCNDLEERLADIADSPNIACRWCIECDQHYALCKCKRPNWKMKTGGQIVELPPHIKKELGMDNQN